jgi:hypothetical protein
MKLKTAILILVVLIMLGGLVWEFHGIKFYTARIEKKK